MILLALDPSSQATGWAVFDDGRLRRCGVWRPKSGSLWARIDATGLAVGTMLDECRPDHVVVEVTSGMTYKRVRAHSLSALAFAQGAVVQAARGPHHRTPVHPVDEQQWTGRRPKKLRAKMVAATEPVYAAFAPKDKGLDAADACGVGLWWLGQRRLAELMKGA